MSKNESSYSKGLLVGAILGGAVGAITALLLAPKSGAELRKDIADKSREAYDKAQDLLGEYEGEITEVVKTTFNEGKVKAQSIVDAARKQADEIMENAQVVLNEAKLKASDTKSNISGKIDQVKSASSAGIQAFKDELNSQTDKY